MDHGHQFKTARPQRFAKLARVDNLAPGGLYFTNLGAAPLSDLSHPRAENAINADQYFIPGLNKIHKTKLHPGAPCSAHGKSDWIFCLEKLAKHLFGLLH